MPEQPRTLHQVTIANITIEWIPPEERTFYADAYRITDEQGRGFLVTTRELEDFEENLGWIKRDDQEA